MLTCYAMNTFVSPSTGFSPYELVFLRKPPDILNLYFEPLQTIAKGYEDYCLTRKPYGFMQSSFWVIMMVHVMVCGDL